MPLAWCVLELEVRGVVKDFGAYRSASYEGILPGLVLGTRVLLEQADSAQQAAKFGGEDAVKRAKQLLSLLDRRAVQLNKLART